MKPKISNLFKNGDFVASFTSLQKASRYTETVSSLSSSIPEAHRCTWQNRKQPNGVMRYTLLGTGYYIEESELDPVLSLKSDADPIEGELGSLKLGDPLGYDDGT